MDNRIFDKSKFPSLHVTEGTSRASHRSYLDAMKLTLEPSVTVQDAFDAVGKYPAPPSPMKTLLDPSFAQGDSVTVTGRTVNDNLRKVVWNDGQDVIWPAATRGACVGHVGQEAAAGGSIAPVRDADIILIDPVKGTVALQIGDAEFEKRKKRLAIRKTNFGSGALWGYAQMVNPAAKMVDPAARGAVTHRGAASGTNAYADV